MSGQLCEEIRLIVGSGESHSHRQRRPNSRQSGHLRSVETKMWILGFLKIPDITMMSYPPKPQALSMNPLCNAFNQMLLMSHQKPMK